MEYIKISNQQHDSLMMKNETKVLLHSINSLKTLSSYKTKTVQKSFYLKQYC